MMIAKIAAYLASVKARDPAARSRLEVLTYPGIWALALHRPAHALYRRRRFLAARILNHAARLLTGIDIHPGAVVGRNLFIDHGFVVIGETAIIGNDVTLYSGVTLGGARPTSSGRVARHPRIGDDVVIGSGAQIIGAIEVGAGVHVGANAVVTRDVAAGTTVVGIPARPIGLDAEPRGASPGEDALALGLKAARAEVERLGRMIDTLEARADVASQPEGPAGRQRLGRGQS